MGKLVRDKIPELIRRDGREPTVTVLDGAAYRTALREKLLEEATELIAATSPEEVLGELADVLEVIKAIAAESGHAWSAVEAQTDDKRGRRGGFSERRFLH